MSDIIFEPDFLMIPFQLIRDKKLEQVDRLLYGVIYWFEHLKDGRCFASNVTLAQLLGTTPRVVQNSLTNLEQAGYIERVYKDAAKRNRMEIRSMIAFRKVSSVGDRQGKLEGVERPVGDRASDLQVTRRRIGKKNKETSIAPGAGAEVNSLIELFKPMNPSYEKLFANRTQRASLESMILKWGEPKVRNAIIAAGQVFGKPYAPTITTPFQLESKLGELGSYLRKESGSKKVGLIKL